MTPRTRAGLVKIRPVRPGSRVAIVAPASGVAAADLEAAAAELKRVGLDAIWDERIFERSRFTAGPARVRALALMAAFDREDVDAVIAARGGYGSVEVLPLLAVDRIRQRRTAFVGYSDVTSIHSVLNTRTSLVSVHGAMVERRLAAGPSAYDPASFMASLSAEPLGIVSPETLEVLQPGEAAGPIVGGTLTQILASFETPFAFAPPDGHVLLVDEVGERPYRLHRMLVQMRFSGRLAKAAAIVFGQLPACDEPGGAVTAKDAIRDALDGFRGPVLFGFPTGHSTTPLVSLPLGVHVRVQAGVSPALVFEEAGAA
jgi:muramoyltetrapeptide carboxypeptidase